MKKSIISLFSSLAVFLLAITFSMSQPLHAQTFNCPAGYTCTPVSSQPVGCPAGYTCTSNTINSSSYSGSVTGYTGVSGGGYNNSNSCFNYTFSTNLSIGSTGADVVSLQTFLISKGFSIRNISVGLTPKGYFGSQTATALRQYQQSAGLTVTGQLDVATRVYINDLCSIATTVITAPIQPIQTPITVISPKHGDVLQVGTPVQINWDGSWSGSDTFNIMWSGQGYGASVASGVSQAQASCSGYGKRVCGIMWTPKSQASQVQIVVSRGTAGNTSDYGLSGWFSVAPITQSGSNVSVVIPTQPSIIISTPTVYCPASYSCTPISSQYPPIPTASGISTGGSCPTGYICNPITVNSSLYSPVPNQISSCTTISQPGIYQLSQDINTSGDCFKITSSNVVIDGKGHTISGDGSSGYGVSVNIGGLSNIRITNISINNFEGNNMSLSSNDSSDVPNKSSVATIFPSSATINSGQDYTFTLGFPSDVTDATISASCPSYVQGGNCNTGPAHLTRESSINLSFSNYLGSSTKQVSVTYNVVTPKGNTSAQALLDVLPGAR